MRVAHERAHALEIGTAVGAKVGLGARSSDVSSSGKRLNGHFLFSLRAFSLPPPLRFPLLLPLLFPHCSFPLPPIEYDEEDDTTDDESFFLRPVTALDFTMAIKKLKASVDDNGKEIMKVGVCSLDCLRV